MGLCFRRGGTRGQDVNLSGITRRADKAWGENANSETYPWFLPPADKLLALSQRSARWQHSADQNSSAPRLLALTRTLRAIIRGHHESGSLGGCCWLTVI